MILPSLRGLGVDGLAVERALLVGVDVAVLVALHAADVADLDDE